MGAGEWKIVHSDADIYSSRRILRAGFKRKLSVLPGQWHVHYRKRFDAPDLLP